MSFGPASLIKESCHAKIPVQYTSDDLSRHRRAPTLSRKQIFVCPVVAQDDTEIAGIVDFGKFSPGVSWNDTGCLGPGRGQGIFGHGSCQWTGNQTSRQPDGASEVQVRRVDNHLSVSVVIHRSAQFRNTAISKLLETVLGDYRSSAL